MAFSFKSASYKLFVTFKISFPESVNLIALKNQERDRLNFSKFQKKCLENFWFHTILSDFFYKTCYTSKVNWSLFYFIKNIV